MSIHSRLNVRNFSSLLRIRNNHFFFFFFFSSDFRNQIKPRRYRIGSSYLLVELEQRSRCDRVDTHPTAHIIQRTDNIQTSTTSAKKKYNSEQSSPLLCASTFTSCVCNRPLPSITMKLLLLRFHLLSFAMLVLLGLAHLETTQAMGTRRSLTQVLQGELFVSVTPNDPHTAGRIDGNCALIFLVFSSFLTSLHDLPCLCTVLGWISL